MKMFNEIISTLQFRRAGLSQVLGELERELIEVLWQFGELTGRELFDFVKRKRDNAYHTVLTVLNRLVKKGLIRKRKIENLYYFSPCLDRGEFEKMVCEEAMRAALEISETNAISAIVDLLSEERPEAIELLEREIRLKRQKSLTTT